MRRRHVGVGRTSELIIPVARDYTEEKQASFEVVNVRAISEQRRHTNNHPLPGPPTLVRSVRPHCSSNFAVSR